jgi:outer membrane murein-binding lipoprotein Lpp
VKRLHMILLLVVLAFVAPAPFIAHAASVSSDLTTPSLDQVYSQVVDLKARVLKLETDNRALKTQMAAMATHTHSMGSHSAGDGGLMTLRQLKFWLDRNECMDCSWQYRVGASRSVESFTGPPKL